MGFLEKNPQMLESPVLPEFQLVLNRKPIFTFEYMDLALIPHMWVSWGTNRWDALEPQIGTSTLLIRLKLHRFIAIPEYAIPYRFHCRGPVGYSSCLNIPWNRAHD